MQWIAEHKIGIWAFAVAVAFIPGIMSAAILPRWAAIAIGAPLVSRLTLERLSQAMQYVLVFGVAWAAVSVLASPDRLSGTLLLFLMLVTIGAFVAASEFETLDDAMTGLACGIGVSSIVSLFFLAGVPVVDQATPQPAGLFYNSEVLAEFTAPVFLWCVLRRKWPLVVATALPMAICGSRIAFLAVAAGALYFYRPRSKAIMAALLLALVGGAFAAIVMIGDEKFVSAGTRVVVWGATLLAATPLGNGLGWFGAAHPVEQFAHSDMIQAINELGIGAVFLAAIPVLILRSNRGTYAERAVFVAICVEVAVSFPLHVPGSAFVAAIVAGYLAGSRAHVFLRRSERRDRNEQGNEWRSATSMAIDGGGGLGRRAISI